MAPHRPFRPGERVLLVDSKARRYLITLAEGNRHLAYKEALNMLEQRSPGAKANFLFSFLERGHDRFAADAETERAELTPCTVCGSPTTGEVCAFCRMSQRINRGPER